MTESQIEASTPPIEVVTADFDELIERIFLRAIAVREVHASRSSGSMPSDFTINVGIQVAPGRLGVDYLFAVTVDMVTAESEAVAQLVAVFVAQFGLTEGRELPETVYHAFGPDLTAILWPYVREQVQDLAGRLQIPGFTLGLLKKPPNPGQPLDVQMWIGEPPADA